MKTRKLMVVMVSLALMATAAPAAGQLPPGGTFVDDDGNTHEAQIEAIAAAGITKGCNPPVNDRYCPEGSVTRGEMAAFLRRALVLPASGVDAFVDDEGSTFEGDIDAIAAAGITKGCNPPANDRYCPEDPVRRDEMASFLARAFGLTPIEPPARVLPSGRPASTVPWDEVDDDWVTVLYDGYGPDQPLDGGPYGLYLIDPDGTRYLMASWSNERRFVELYDWSPDGERVLIRERNRSAGGWPQELIELDLVDGARTTLLRPTGNEVVIRARYTRPTGANVVVYRSTDTEYLLERRSTEGALLSTLAAFPACEGCGPELDWLYRPGGTGLVIGDGTSLRLHRPDGTVVRDLAHPARACWPARWWARDTVLASCMVPGGLGGQLSELWLVPVDGSAAKRLTAPSTTESYSRAFQVEDEVWGEANWMEESGTGWTDVAEVHVLDEAGRGRFWGPGNLLGVVGDRLLLRLELVEGSPAYLMAANRDGGGVTLIEPMPFTGRNGVTGVGTRPDPVPPLRALVLAG